MTSRVLVLAHEIVGVVAAMTAGVDVVVPVAHLYNRLSVKFRKPQVLTLIWMYMKRQSY